MGLGIAASAIPSRLLASDKLYYSDSSGENLEDYSFPELPYSYDALEPYIDSMTMEIHYDRHHRGYYNKFIAAVKDTQYDNMPLEQLFSRISDLPAAIRNNGGGLYNHTLFWNNMTPEKTSLSKQLARAIDEAFGSFDSFREEFSNAAATRFGSGWAWLVLAQDGSLKVSSTANQDNPMMDVSEVKGFPLLALDVWEHAYYLKYQNKRGDYISSFWKVVNWDAVSKRYEKAVKAL